MDDEILSLLKSHVHNDNTRKNYIYRLNGLKKKMAPLSNVKDEVLLFHILTHPRKYYPMIKTSYDDKTLTVKNIITVILATFKYTDLRTKLQSPYKKWLEYHEEYCEKEDTKYSKNRPSSKQEENYITLDELKEVVHNMKHSKIHTRTKKLSMHYCLLSMYLYIRPKRADFGDIKIHFETDPGSKDHNYLVLKQPNAACDRPSYFVFNHVNKTHRSSTDPIIEHVPAELSVIFINSVARFPRDYLFEGTDNQAFKTSNSFTKFVIAAFKKHTGKGTGVSLLRHMYINEMVDLNKLSIEEKEAIASAMGHSRKLQEQYKLFFNNDHLNTPKEGASNSR